MATWSLINAFVENILDSDLLICFRLCSLCFEALPYDSKQLYSVGYISWFLQFCKLIENKIEKCDANTCEPLLHEDFCFVFHYRFAFNALFFHKLLSGIAFDLAVSELLTRNIGSINYMTTRRWCWHVIHFIFFDYQLCIRCIFKILFHPVKRGFIKYPCDKRAFCEHHLIFIYFTFVLRRQPAGMGTF